MDLDEILGWGNSMMSGAKKQALSARKENLVRWVTEMSIKYKKDQTEIVKELKKTFNILKKEGVN